MKNTWESLLFEMKVYGYYPTGIYSLTCDLANLKESIEKIYKEKGVFNFIQEKNNLKIDFDRTYIDISHERAKRKLVYPFLFEEEYFQLLLHEILDPIENYVPLDILGIDCFLMNVLAILTLISNEPDQFYNFPKPKSPGHPELNMMKRTLQPSDNFLRWKALMDKHATSKNLIKKYFSDTYLYNEYNYAFWARKTLISQRADFSKILSNP